MDRSLANNSLRVIYNTIKDAYSAMNDYASGEKCQRELLNLYQDSIESVEKGHLHFRLAKANVRFWVHKAAGVVRFSKEEMSLDKNVLTGVVPDLDEFFRKSFSDPSKDITQTKLLLCYKIIIALVVHLLKEPEIIIVPDPCMYQVPFAALTDQEGRCLSETRRIRIVPSLTTLKVIQDSPPDYHSQTGALILGDPKVGVVLYQDRRKDPSPLPCAKRETEMIGELFGVTPLVGEHATKQAVLQAINFLS
ncbi:Tetratricopeptide repeat protein 28 [Stylophora pistillata]|uniref:Tetratricopeptide repeat protein 28 n=1 Tax=Stylophora pistillata TaxID=50429 RepID=A0A2B4R5B1_STYPI|nr:Tetratricopeptide repeat protein 28 [Stylophora pistillata]